jgi:tRNA/rRNA methyltransferase
VPPERLSVVLVRPHLPANLGSVARVCRNFGVPDLRLVEPAAPADDESRRLASGADDVLDGLRRYPSLPDALADCDAVVATSSLRGREERRFLALSELPAFLEGLGASARAAFVFGPERQRPDRGRALPRERVTAPADRARLPDAEPLSRGRGRPRGRPALRRGRPGPLRALATASEIEATIAHWDRALEAIGFYDTGHRERSLRDWRKIVASRPLTEREVAMLRGVANRVLVSLRRLATDPLRDGRDKPA